MATPLKPPPPPPKPTTTVEVRGAPPTPNMASESGGPKLSEATKKEQEAGREMLAHAADRLKAEQETGAKMIK